MVDVEGRIRRERDTGHDGKRGYRGKEWHEERIARAHTTTIAHGSAFVCTVTPQMSYPVAGKVAPISG